MRMNRREFMKSGAMAGASGFVLSNRSMDVSVTTRRPNVLFVLADQWRFCSVSHGENNDPVVQTPNLDKLAEEGVRFSRCYTAHPRCTPNRASLITGRFPHETGMIDNDLMTPPAQRCIAHGFSEAGYKSHYIGKWHMDGTAKPGFVPPNWRRRGFETFVGFNRGHSYFNTGTFTNDGVKVSAEGEYEPTLQTDYAIDFMTANKDKPFFCFVSWGPPHGPLTPNPVFDIYNESQIVFRPNDMSLNGSRQAKYFGSCTSLDHEFGRLMAAVKQLGLEDNTLVVFNSDHGDMGGSHGKSNKNEPEEESSHVPLLMRMPGRLKKAAVATNLISTIDLMPTILSLCGLEVPSTCTGKDKSAAALIGRSMADESIYIEESIKSWWRAVVKGRYKYVVYSDETGSEPVPAMLFDLEQDPYEMDNLIGNATFAQVRADMQAEMDMWKQKTSDPFPAIPEAAKKMYSV